MLGSRSEDVSNSAYANAESETLPHVFQANIIIFELIQDIIEINLLTKFYEDSTINKASRVLTRFYYSHITKNAQPPGGHFHEDWAINVASRSHIMKKAPPLNSHEFQAKFHEDRKINVASRVLTRKNALPPGGHVFQPTGIIFELFQDIIGMNLLTKFHEDWTINVASRVLTRFYYSHIRKNAPPLGSHVFQAKVTIFDLIQDIIGKNRLSKFHNDRKINVDSRVLTRKNAPPPWMPYIIGMNLLTKFHEDHTINVASTVLTRFFYSHLRKNAPPLGSHVFQANVTIFQQNRHIQKRHVLTKFHEDWTKNVTSRVFTCFHYIHIEKTALPPGSHVFSPIWTIFELFHDDWAKIVTSRVFTRNTAPPPGSHLHEDFASNVTSTVVTSFELSRGINGTNVLTKFHEDHTINVAFRVFTRQNVDDGRRTKGDHKSSP
ncbi:hypothetical protein DPMN_011655 [Dreissena polymorpha]|uniref:Uncharacterized protein n=1 Tax=Dreissena polymorpha TaxID=45954 RepID=A0A9D4N6J5_DREPO|nr:hypothetical protein DPMN_011655 [Dreissena polymorpha]